MKKHFITALAAVSLLATLSSCSKDEAVEEKPKPVTTSSIVGPSLGTFVQIDTITAEYLSGTTKIEFPKSLKIRTSYNTLKDDKLTVFIPEYFFLGAKEPSGEGYGIKPYVETRCIVGAIGRKYASDAVLERQLTFVLSKKVTDFGFEIPTMGWRREYIATYWDKKTKTKVGSISNLPNPFPTDQFVFSKRGYGASLMAVKSTVPFDSVQVKFIRDLQWPNDIGYQGFAQLRYKLAD